MECHYRHVVEAVDSRVSFRAKRAAYMRNYRRLQRLRRQALKSSQEYVSSTSQNLVPVLFHLRPEAEVEEEITVSISPSVLRHDDSADENFLAHQSDSDDAPVQPLRQDETTTSELVICHSLDNDAIPEHHPDQVAETAKVESQVSRRKTKDTVRFRRKWVRPASIGRREISTHRLWVRLCRSGSDPDGGRSRQSEPTSAQINHLNSGASSGYILPLVGVEPVVSTSREMSAINYSSTASTLHLVPDSGPRLLANPASSHEPHFLIKTEPLSDDDVSIGSVYQPSDDDFDSEESPEFHINTEEESGIPSPETSTSPSTVKIEPPVPLFPPDFDILDVLIKSEPSSDEDSVYHSDNGNSAATGSFTYVSHLKQSCCPYCHQLFTALPKHLRRHHGSEPEMAVLTTERSRARQNRIFTLLRNTGNRWHNAKVRKSGKGTLIVRSRRATNSSMDMSINSIYQKSDGGFSYVSHLKESCCYYCHEVHTSLPKHLRRKHGLEKELVALYAERSKARQNRIYTLLRNKGNHWHNTDAQKRGSGTLIVRTRKNDPPEAGCCYDYCPKCLGYYPERELGSEHQCFRRPSRWITEQPEDPEELKWTVALRNLLHQIPETEPVATVMRTDPTIQELGLHILRNAGQMEGTEVEARAREQLESLALVLLELRRKIGMQELNLAQGIHPENVPAFAKVARELKLARNVFGPLSECAALCRAKCLEKGAQDEARRYELFLQRCISERLLD